MRKVTNDIIYQFSKSSIPNKFIMCLRTYLGGQSSSPHERRLSLINEVMSPITLIDSAFNLFLLISKFWSLLSWDKLNNKTPYACNQERT